MRKIETTSTSPAEFTERFINQTNQSIFLTGKAGTGKTTLLRKIVDSTHKNTVIVAPTGIAALNAGGVTIHSFFQLPFGGFIPEFIAEPVVTGHVKLETKETLKRHFHFNATRQNLFRSVELLIIDEVSMLRADLLDAMDWTLRNVRKNNQAFGGVQVLFIGDLLQLPPVIKPEEWTILKNYYSGIFFFNAHVLRESPPLYLELDKIYRQDDTSFIEILNNLRNNRVTESDQALLNQYVQPQFDPTKETGYITLTTHNSKADTMNASALKALDTASHFYEAEITGDFPNQLYPIDAQLELKIGAQIMFIKNDISFEKLFFNGKMGIVDALSEEEIIVYFPDEKRKITVEKYEWNNIKYSLDPSTAEIKEEILGTFVQYPLKLAWAITVHKSQGLTFEKAVLDVSQVFAPGQAYVALSRLISLKGLVLLQPISMNGLVNDQSVVAYSEQKIETDQLVHYLDRETARFIYHTLEQTFDLYDYTSKWASFDVGLKIHGPKTEKGKDKSWSANQLQTVQNTFAASKKFQVQLAQLFSKETIDWNFVHERVQAAYTYFYKPLDAQVYSIMKRRIELAKIKRTKEYMEELEELQEMIICCVLQLKKSKLLMEAIIAGSEINRDTIRNAEIQNYKIAKIALIQQEMRQNKSLLDLDDEHDFESMRTNAILSSTKGSASEKVKKIKKSTHEITLEMIELGKDIATIARERQLSATTINGHLVQLIRTEKIQLEQVMDSARIQEIEAYFEGFEGSSLTPLKERIGNKVSWDELKLVQASKML